MSKRKPSQNWKFMPLGFSFVVSAKPQAVVPGVVYCLDACPKGEMCSSGVLARRYLVDSGFRRVRVELVDAPIVTELGAFRRFNP